MSRLSVYLLIMLFSAIWSSAFIVGKLAFADYDPFSTLVLRFLLAALVLYLICIFTPGRWSRPALSAGLVLGLLNNGIYLGCTFFAMQFITPVLVVVIVSCAPFLTLALSAISGVERMGMRKLGGMILGFFGVLLITGIDLDAAPNPTGVALAGAGTLAFSVATVAFRAKAQSFPIMQLNLWQSISGAAALLPIALIYGQPLRIPSPTAAFAILYLTLVVSIGAMGLWFFLIRLTGAASASAYHLLNPFFALAQSAAVFGAPVTATDILGASVIACGLVLASNRAAKKQQTSKHQRT